MGRAKRDWGPWTQEKLRILAKYLQVFTTASSSLSECVYLDAFAGEGTGVARLTGEEFKGSAQIGLETEPPFTKLRLFELDPRKARELELHLAHTFPERDVLVYPGDCNATIPEALAALEGVAWAPTFAFLDPDGMQLAWETMEKIAQHRQSKKGLKVEMWVLFTHLLTRTLPLKKEATPEDLDRAKRFFGTDQCLRIYERRRANEITPAEARAQYLNLFRWRLEKDLGYTWTHPLTIVNTRNRPIYEMVFATDHKVGSDVMTYLYDGAAQWLPAKMRRAREDAAGVQTMFGFEDIEAPAKGYEHIAPEDPQTL